MTSRMSSGSSRADSAVEPTRSQNMTVSWRRSAAGSMGAENLFRGGRGALRSPPGVRQSPSSAAFGVRRRHAEFSRDLPSLQLRQHLAVDLVRAEHRLVLSEAEAPSHSLTSIVTSRISATDDRPVRTVVSRGLRVDGRCREIGAGTTHNSRGGVGARPTTASSRCPSRRQGLLRSRVKTKASDPRFRRQRVAIGGTTDSTPDRMARRGVRWRSSPQMRAAKARSPPVLPLP